MVALRASVSFIGVVLIGVAVIGVAVIGVAVIGACAPGPAEPGQWEAAIANGKVHAGHPAVGRMAFPDTRGPSIYVCTATLVGKKTVVAAAHCMWEQKMELTFAGSLHSSYKTVVHPKYNKGQPEHDLAVFLLSSAPQVTPLPISAGAPSAGEAVTLVGHGETEAGGGSEVKRVATNTIASVQALTFKVVGRGGADGNACTGDSGTPGFTTSAGGQEALAGVVTKVLGCDDTTLTRLDAHADWLQEAAGGDLELLRTAEPESEGCGYVPAAARGTTGWVGWWRLLLLLALALARRATAAP